MLKITKQFDPQSEMGRHLQLLRHGAFGVTELRVFEPQPMVAYADNREDVIRMAVEQDGRASGIYVGVQPRRAALFHHAPNRWQPITVKPRYNCACDGDIEYITTCFFDIGVVSQLKGYPASDEELERSLKAARLLAREAGLAFCSTICASGNGHYVLAPTAPIPVNNEQVAHRFRQFCQHLVDSITAQVSGVKFNPVFNLSQVMRLMGTVNAKGIPTADRPHRRTYFSTEPLPAVSQALSHMILNTELTAVPSNYSSSSNALKSDLSKTESCSLIRWCRGPPR